MRRMVGLVIAVAACGGGGAVHHDASPTIDASPTTDASPDAALPCIGYPPACVPTSAPTAPATSSALCNPLTQTGCLAGEKCTWLHDAPGAGHIGCAPAGAVQLECHCTFGADGATGYDDCIQGLVCSTGSCRAICDLQRGSPMCDATHSCVAHEGLFSPGAGSPNAAGVCDPMCDPLVDNDIGGSGWRGCACGSNQGCYGYPSLGTPPATAFSCGLLGSTNLVNGSPVPAQTYINSCAQGYIPLFQEMTGSTQIVCIAMCAPLDCYAGHCGGNDANRFGAAPHRCMNPDAQGTFDGSADGDECKYMWSEEVDSTGTLLRSPYSDTLGVCFDHAKFRYDSNGDGQVTSADLQLPACQDLQIVGSGSNAADPTTYFGAADLGCVNSTTAGLPPQRPRRVLADVRIGTRR